MMWARHCTSRVPNCPRQRCSHRLFPLPVVGTGVWND